MIQLPVGIILKANNKAPRFFSLGDLLLDDKTTYKQKGLLKAGLFVCSTK